MPRKPMSPAEKRILIGVSIVVAMMLIFTGLLFSNFRLKTLDAKAGGNLQGSAGIASGQMIRVQFTTGDFEIETSPGTNLVWNCQGEHSEAPNAETRETTLVLDLSAVPRISCKLGVPARAQLALHGDEGRVGIYEPNFDVETELQRGTIEFESDETSNYIYDVKVEDGKADEFISSAEPGGFKAKLHLGSGKITHDE